MDPIHPIVPLPPAIPPVTAAPMVGRIDRDNAQDNPGEDKRRRRRKEAEPGADEPTQDAARYEPVGPDGEDDQGLHIDVSA
jgi:hypothetical protein